MRVFSKGALLCAAVAVAACGKAQERHLEPVPSGDRTMGEEEILATKAGNIYDVIRLRRPNWLQRFGGRPTSLTGPPAEVVVYLDGQRFGGRDSLVRLSATSVRWVEFLTPSEAQARFGQGNLGGVIHVHTHGTPGQ
ncbi:MAG: hypothetical protein OEO20_03805 [Gemmatimonadota bacterium]|nr:hypothetical protein [Gemmatimonadota bacterium]MDH3367580.1 hypothetical protein [Gemmatimonadota bacterium]MDH3477410.1 hypothetical protein [Gemmatimonadota bacterium]MDH3569303.1 hypothetical protein [Gemmatimonadota bacterium]MDH5550705.1 hypothetical protein [Gemmatimonadota bacterium]